MSKYIKSEDMENLIINIAPDGDVFTRGMSALKSLPTIDIVRCKDCKYSEVYLLDSNGEPQRWCKVGLAKAVGDDDYCSWGE